MPTGQSDEGIFSDKVPSFQMSPSCVKLQKQTNTSPKCDVSISLFPSRLGGSLWTKEQKDFKNKGGNFKESLSRQKREDTNINSQWLWKYALILHKLNQDKIPVWGGGRGHAVPSLFDDLLASDCFRERKFISFMVWDLLYQPHSRAGLTLGSSWPSQRDHVEGEGQEAGEGSGRICEEIGEGDEDDQNTFY